MARGPKSEKRPADVISNAAHVMRIATGEIEESATPDHAMPTSTIMIVSGSQMRLRGPESRKWISCRRLRQLRM